MKRILIACAIAGGTSLAASVALAQGHGGGFHGSGGGGGWHGGGGSWHGGGFHGGHFHGGFHGHGFVGSVFIGAPFFWPWYYDYPAYTYYGYPSYYYDYPTQVYVEPQTSVPAQPAARYYCPDAGYYPTVATCPRGWLRVLPDSAPPSY